MRIPRRAIRNVNETMEQTWGVRANVTALETGLRRQ